jgi:hypothetical protein
VHNLSIRVIERPTRRTLRVNVRPSTGTISIKDVAVDIGLGRSEALALARALTKAVRELDNANHPTDPAENTATS